MGGKRTLADLADLLNPAVYGIDRDTRLEVDSRTDVIFITKGDRRERFMTREEIENSNDWKRTFRQRVALFALGFPLEDDEP